VTASNEEPGRDSSIDEVRADIGATREQLRETVAALGEKVDVKRRAEQKVAETKAVIRHQGQELGAKARAHPAIPLGAVAAVAAVVIPRRRRHRPGPTRVGAKLGGVGTVPRGNTSDNAR
jgi:uncharacterized protein DUF3618